MAKRLIKSAEETENQKDEDQFEIDESIVDEVSNAEEFADVEITNEDIMDAIEAIDALADAVIEKADAEEKEINADELLDQVTEMLEGSHEEDDEGADEEVSDEEFELEEEEELPEEIANSVVRVMVSEDGAIDVEQTPDAVYDETVDGMECTVFDTCDDYPLEDMEETADVEDTEDDVLIIGNSASKKYRKGYITLKSSANKRAWSHAYRKVKKMVGSSKLKAVHWAIVSALAEKEAAKKELDKKIKCCLVKCIKNNKDRKIAFFKSIKSELSQDDIQPEGQTETEAKPDMIAEPENNGFEEQSNDGVPAEAGDPDGVTEEFGNPEEDPDRQDEREDEIVLPEENIVVVDVPVTNSTRKIKLQKVRSSKERKYNLYKVVSDRNVSMLDGMVVKSGKLAYCFRATSQGMLACCAKFVPNGKGRYKPVIKNNKVVITRGGEFAPIFQNYENIQIARAIVSARRDAVKSANRKAPGVMRGRRTEIMNRLDKQPATSRRPVRNRLERKPVMNGLRKPAMNGLRKPVMNSNAMAVKRAQFNERKAIESKLELQRLHEQEERQRIFQSSQAQMNEERVAIKSRNARNEQTLNKAYGSMF